jgi:hypothetical protein
VFPKRDLNTPFKALLSQIIIMKKPKRLKKRILFAYFLIFLIAVLVLMQLSAIFLTP